MGSVCRRKIAVMALGNDLVRFNIESASEEGTRELEVEVFCDCKPPMRPQLCSEKRTFRPRDFLKEAIMKTKVWLSAVAALVVPLSACGSDEPERAWIDDYADTASATELAYARSGTNHPGFNLAVASSAVIADGQITITGFNDSALQYKDVPKPHLDVPAGDADRTVDRKPIGEWMGDLHEVYANDAVGDHNPNASISLADEDGNPHGFAIEVTDVAWDDGTGTAVLSFNPLVGESIPDGSYTHVSLQIDAVFDVVWNCGWLAMELAVDVLSEGEFAVMDAIGQVKDAIDCAKAIHDTWFAGGTE